MTRRTLLRGAVLAGAGGLVLGNPHSSSALFGVGDIVHDPIQNATNMLTAIRSLASNVHEVTIINQQIQQLANEARNLATLPLSIVRDIQRTMTTYQQLLAQGRSLAYDAKHALTSFDQLFTNGNIPPLQRLGAIFQEIRATGRLVTEVQSIYDQLCLVTAKVEQAGQASDAAIGILQAQQAGNDLGILTVQQLQTLNTLTATQHRFDTLRYMEQVVEEDLTQKRAQAWMAGWPTTTTTQGFQLP